jgi:hypothetical protein
VNVADVAKVSEIFAASIFRVEVRNMGEFGYINMEEPTHTSYIETPKFARWASFCYVQLHDTIYTHKFIHFTYFDPDDIGGICPKRLQQRLHSHCVTNQNLILNQT